MKCIVKDNENWLLVFKIVPGGVSWPLGPAGGGGDILSPRKEESWTTLAYTAARHKHRYCK
jgi:hypothetical protein